MPEPKPLTSATRLTTTVGVILATIAGVFAAGAWATEIAVELKHVSENVANISVKIDTIETIDRRLTVVETKVEAVLRELKP